MVPAHAGIEVLKPYQMDRLIGFVNPDSDLSGTTDNVNESVTAVGAGGLDGRGVDGATQTNRIYLPEHATVFIFACSPSSEASSAQPSCRSSTPSSSGAGSR